MGLNSQQLNELNQDERLWDALVDEFDAYRQQWQKQGVLPMLREIMGRRHLAENLLASEGRASFNRCTAYWGAVAGGVADFG